MTNRFVLAADTDNVFRMVASVKDAGIFFSVHSNARLDGIFIVARSIFNGWLCVNCFQRTFMVHNSFFLSLPSYPRSMNFWSESKKLTYTPNNYYLIHTNRMMKWENTLKNETNISCSTRWTLIHTWFCICVVTETYWRREEILMTAKI